MTDNGLKEFASRTLKGFSHILFPPGAVCSFCGSELDSCIATPSGACAEVCSRCVAKLASIQDSCNVCGAESVSPVCIRCKGRRPEFDRCVSVSSYDGFAVNILYKLKNGQRFIAKDIAALMENTLVRSKQRFDVVTFVPMTSQAVKRKGYNHSGLLAKLIASAFNLPCEELLQKTRETQRQKTLSAPERLKNLKGAYAAARGADVAGKTVLIVDDVITTGITLSQCAAALKSSAGCKKAVCVTFAAVSHNRIAAETAD